MNPSDPTFSMFLAPIANTTPKAAVTLRDVFSYITSDVAKDSTSRLRSLAAEQRAKFKASHFDYCTFSGIYSKRSVKGLVAHSGLICFDFDHLTDVEASFNTLILDRYFPTLLLFRSPSGDGLKWVISMREAFSHRAPYFPNDNLITYHSFFFSAVAQYLRDVYGLTADEQCKDIARACFLPYDPNAYLSSNLL